MFKKSILFLIFPSSKTSDIFFDLMFKSLLFLKKDFFRLLKKFSSTVFTGLKKSSKKTLNVFSSSLIVVQIFVSFGLTILKRSIEV